MLKEDNIYKNKFKHTTMIQQLIGVDVEMVIEAISERIEMKEYVNFPSTRIRLCQIQRKLINGVELSENDIITLTNEYYV